VIPQFPEIEQAQTVLAALAETDDVKSATAARQRRLKLQTSYGQALAWSRGFDAEETKIAFNRALELAADTGNVAERLVAYYGLWLANFPRDPASTRAAAEIFLREAGAEGRPMEAAVAHRCVGLTSLFQGEFVAARRHLVEALKGSDPERDRDARVLFGIDLGSTAAGHLACAAWILGEVDESRRLIDTALERAEQVDHAPSLVNVRWYQSMLEILRRDADAANRAATIVVDLSQKNGMATFVVVGALCTGWSQARLGGREGGGTELRHALAAYVGAGGKLAVAFFEGLLAELEAEWQDLEEALARIENALTVAQQTGDHWSDALLHRIRGEILFKRDGANTAPAEEALLTAIAIAQQQKAKSFELQAALRLAKLYQSTDRATDAHAVLAPALEGFSPTPQFPEIEQARQLLEMLE
jgi:predicted ATPase